MEEKCILLDSSFFMRFVNDGDRYHQNALNYYKFFLENNFRLKCSTISIAEYCVKGKIDELPLKDLEILPFNINHAVKAGEFAYLVFANRDELQIENRAVIPNDSKLFAQAHIESEITSFATSDQKCIKVHNLLQQHFKVNFEIIDITESLSKNFGVLPFEG